MASTQTIYLLYHFFHPDDVISARLYSELAESLAADGSQQVVAFPSNRSCHDAKLRLPRHEDWNGVKIRRVWRPPMKQSRPVGRLLNSLFMLVGWTWRAIVSKRPSRRGGDASSETVVIGTDPVFGVLAAIPWRVFRPKVRIVHWCHDVHPEAAIADGSFRANSLALRLLRRLLRIAYQRCDVVIDLGDGMRRLLAQAGGWQNPGRSKNPPLLETITPWSLVESQQPVPICTKTRQELFGDARLTLLYSGNIGRAHDMSLLIEVARACRNQSIGFCFAGRGPGMETLRDSLEKDDTNISFGGFASEEDLQRRLSACDIHMVSLKDSWTGTVVPSKFFGALAIGRPVLFAGSAESSLASYINTLQVGWHVTADSVEQVANALIAMSADPSIVSQKRAHCWEAYRDKFSREVQLSKWQRVLSQ